MDYIYLVMVGFSCRDNPVISFIDKLGYKLTYELEIFESSIGDFSPCWFTVAKRQTEMPFRWVATYQVTDYCSIVDKDEFNLYTPIEDLNKIKTVFAGLFFDNEHKTFINNSEHLVNFKDLKFGVASFYKEHPSLGANLLNIYGDESLKINIPKEGISDNKPNYCLKSLVDSDIFCTLNDFTARERMESVKDFYAKKGKDLFLVKFWRNLVIF